jgi:hypothetical protein
MELNKKQGSTLGQLVLSLGLYSNAEITNIASGRRSVSYKVLDKIKWYLQLSKQDQYYLDLIAEVDRNESNTSLLSLLNKEISQISTITSL